MGKGKKPQPAVSRSATVAVWREVLGITAGEKPPKQASTGSRASGTKTARTRDRKTKPAEWRGRYTPDVKVTAEQVRAETCPRCLAGPGKPCRNQTGGAVSAGHAARRTLAQRVEVKRLRGRRHEKEPPLSRGEHQQLVARAERARQERSPRIDPATGKKALSVDAAFTRDYTARPGKPPRQQGGAGGGKLASAT
ncbi:hypothetical protein AB0M35_04135 [Micromonospora sp. NPDC051196]|uniref:zinc finger domain-containing protein n=1 Tax=Micromonospora sp. NPDC051196 TaxID=3155281 RepID=UPI0034209319